MSQNGQWMLLLVLRATFGAGINSIMFYAPIIFKTISANGALLSTVITGVINVVTTFVSVALVDRVGRKV